MNTPKPNDVIAKLRTLADHFEQQALTMQTWLTSDAGSQAPEPVRIALRVSIAQKKSDAQRNREYADQLHTMVLYTMRTSDEAPTW